MPARLKEAEIAERLKRVPDWERQGEEISRIYTFGSFGTAVAFVNQVADIAEKLDHHPDILLQYKKVRLSVSTHSAGGLTELDFTLAQRIDAQR